MQPIIAHIETKICQNIILNVKFSFLLTEKHFNRFDTCLYINHFLKINATFY